ncbi:hypothetical protein Q0590_05310 [Rhodocytophaga aerolata]|uniref:Uncharacterized protein n=1 Tax=Rhodocytophaga aerolata TaxID=455078 RepID=A0ABT8R0N3_9BACT|nr:hypothetical protein [Rhodocytophaga aerolata]MDO1445655.1 hypothetical protein [Rhodocytophaga aerolata]
MEGIDFSITREKLIALLGETTFKGKSRKKDKYPTVLKYDKVEFYFISTEDNRLNGIIIQPNISPAPSGKISYMYGWVKGNMAFIEVTNKLNESAIDYQITNDATIKTNSGIDFWFYRDTVPQENLILCKIGRFVELPI